MSTLVSQVVQMDYTSIKGCLPYGVTPSDIDGVVEHNGHFLWIETKWERKALSGGQHRMLVELSRVPKMIVCVVSTHKTPTGVQNLYKFDCEAIRMVTPGGLTDWYDIDTDDFKAFLKEWWHRHDK